MGKGMTTKAGMRCQKNDWVVIGPNHDIYLCADNIFRKTYGHIAGTLQQYKKIGRIRGMAMKQDFLIETLEGLEYGKAGDYLAQNITEGEQWPIKKKVFEETYEQVEGDEENSTNPKPDYHIPDNHNNHNNIQQ